MIHWLLETALFGEREEALAEAARRLGHRASAWKDSWWESGRFPCNAEERVLFHGSLENAARMAADPRFSPGAFCDVSAFSCSSWYPRARPYLLNQEAVFTTVRALVEQPERILPEAPRLFIRPDSPLKPFAGRVLGRGELTLAALDHGYYYLDVELPIVVSPAQAVGAEYRLVIAGGAPVAGSRYEPQGRRGLTPCPPGQCGSTPRRWPPRSPRPSRCT